MLSDTARVIHASALTEGELALEDLDASAVVAGSPRIRSLAVVDGPGAVGVWQHSTGVTTDTEADEVFVVLSGRATIEVEDGPVLEVGAGDIGLLPAGARTRWTVHETLRKVYVIPS